VINAASLKVTVGADVNAALKGMDRVTAAVGGFARTIGGLVVSGAAALAAGLAITTKTAADFEQSMANVRSVMSPADAKAYGAELSRLALTLGKDTSFSATQAAAGIEELVKAGIPLPAILGGAARSALNLAAAGGIPVADAANIASAALNAFKRPAEDLPKIVDHLAGAANASATDMMGLKLGLSQVAPAAALVGLSMEDTTTALALFSNSGLVGSDAGTSLKTMLLNLQPVTKTQTALFKKLGLITKNGSNQFFDAQGNVKDLAGISDVLGKSLAGMTKKQKLATLETLFGSDAIRAAGILAEQGAAGVNALQTEIGKVTAAEVAAERLNTLNGRMEALKGSAETLAITIGTPLIEPLKGLAAVGTETLNALTGHVQAFLTETDKLAGETGISKLNAALLITKENLNKAFGPETAALFASFVNSGKGALGWMNENLPKAFKFLGDRLPGSVETLSATANEIGRQHQNPKPGVPFGLGIATLFEGVGEMFSHFDPSMVNLFPAAPTQEQNLAALAQYRAGAAGGGMSSTTVNNTFTGPVTQEMIDYAIFEAAAAARADSAHASDADLLVAR
jgi:TP901 family phage tail tape measure protein